MVVGINASFALAITALLATAAGLFFRRPRWRSAVVLLFPPLAPWWAARERMYIRAGTFLLGTVAYVVARIVAALMA